MNILKTILLVSCFPAGLALCRGEHSADSVKTYPMNEVTVTASGVRADDHNASSPIFRISAHDIAVTNAMSVGEVLQGKPGLFVREYGVGGSLQTVSFRGMSAEHTLVLVDGVPVNNIQLGLMDVRLLPLDYTERVEFVRGGSSGIYGSNALGGVISIVTEGRDSLSSLHSDASMGSFGMKRLSVVSHLAFERGSGITFGGSTEYGLGNYPVIIDQNGKKVEDFRKNSDFHTRDVFMKGIWHHSAETYSSILVSSLTTERGTPGFFFTSSPQSLARQADEQFLLIGSFHTVAGERWEYMSSGSFQNSYERYVDAAGLFSTDNYYRNISASFSPRVRYRPASSAVLISGIDVDNAFANGNALDSRKTRFHIGPYARAEIHSSIDSSSAGVSVYPALRFDKYEAEGEAWSPKLGIALRSSPLRFGLLDEVSMILHSTIGRDFRVPTFNELYYAGGGGFGNPSLKPERSVSFDIGLTIEYALLGSQHFDITYYSINTDNRILWLPTSSSLVYSPVNIDKTQSTGFEAEYRWTFPSRRIELDGNYSLLNARKKTGASANDPSFDKQLMFVPLETGSVTLKVHVPVHEGMMNGFFFWLADNFTGQRFIVEDNTDALPSYHVLNGNMGIEVAAFGAGVTLKYEIQNLTDKRYEVMPHYPMPLRHQAAVMSISKFF